jgi:hypothetical protein
MATSLMDTTGRGETDSLLILSNFLASSGSCILISSEPARERDA